jgi:predicted S18 family serine protease
MRIVKISLLINVLLIGLLIYLLAQHGNTREYSSDGMNYVTIPIAAANDEIGMIGNATLRLVPGNGKILFEGNPAIETDMQYSMIISAAYAQDHTGKRLNNTDLVIDIDMPLDTLGGISSGAAITVGAIALLEGKKINNSIVLTGAVSPDGLIRRVGEVREKALAASDSGYEILLVPPGQSRFRNQSYNLQEYVNNTIEIREVGTIAQAAEIMIG